ncbi:MAG: hypothetical protein R3359_10930 [Marinirhabdus sp.]|nr:hypothetical protein [Marinirhabdus sp.]
MKLLVYPLLFCSILFIPNYSVAQVGIGTTNPSAQVDIVHANSTQPALEVNHSETSNPFSAVYIRNQGTNRAIYAENLLSTSNAATGFFYQSGNGGNAHGLQVNMESTTIASGLVINHAGTQGFGSQINISGTNNTNRGLQIAHSGQAGAVYGYNNSNAITGTIRVGEFAYQGTDVDDHVGVYGGSTPTTGYGIGVLGQGNWYGIFSNGDFGATGAKTFIADNPLDPGNKFLKHFSIESDEVLNMYRGVVALDSNGMATVQLPDYFEAINRNVSYQLTSIGSPQPPYVVQEIEGNTFVVAGQAGAKVSWLIIAERNDAYMQQHPEARDPEPLKKGPRKDKYITPEFYGQSKEQALYSSDSPDTMVTKKTKAVEPPVVNLPNAEQLEISAKNGAR